VEAPRSLPGPFPSAHDSAAVANAARGAFERLGATGLTLESFTFRNDAGRFVPVSRLNQVRRDLVADLEEAQRRQRAERVARIQAEAGGGCGARLERAGEASRQARSKRAPQAASEDLSPEGFRWSLKVDRIHFLDALEDSDLAGVE